MPEGFSDLEARLTETARASLQRAGLLAHNSGSQYIGTEHVLLGVLAQNSSLGAKILAENGVTLDRAEMALDLTAQPFTVVIIQKGMNAEVLEMMRTAWQLAVEFGQSRIGTEHIIYSILLQQDARATKLLHDMNVDIAQIRGRLEDMFDRQQFEAMQDEYEEIASRDAQTARKVLDQYGTDLTERARAGGLDPITGRDRETARLITILGRRHKNNPALIGEPGVGKTAVVEGLAQRIVAGQVPEFLQGKRLVQLDVASMVAGTKFRGQFEERLQKIIAIVRAHQEIILFIDELHLLVGAGSAEGSMDAANVLKPALARGELRLIGATTFEEYRKYIEKDAALSRRFQAVTVAEPDTPTAIQMVRVVADKLAAHHRLTISDEVVQCSVELSQRYLTDRRLPDKAIDVLDEAAALVNASRPARQTKRQKLTRQLAQLADTLDMAVESEEYQRAAMIKMQMRQLERQRADLPPENPVLPRLVEADVRRAVAAMTGVPVEKVAASERKSLVKLEQRLRRSVIGQDEAVATLARTIRRARAGLSRQSGPLGSFVFLGPTGVGKTELSKALADVYFGGEGKLIRLDLNEFVRSEDVARLIADGADDPMSLTAQVMKQPFSVVLLDEIEKAAPEVLTTLLQLLDEGILRDAKNREISFRDAIVIATSNAGADRIREYIERGYRLEQFEQQFINELISSNQFRPEFLNRFDEIVLFRPFTPAELVQVLDLILAGVNKTLLPQKVSVTVDDDAKQLLVQQGYDPRLGARPMRRVVQKAVENTIAKLMLSGAVNPGDSVNIDAEQVRRIFEESESQVAPLQGDVPNQQNQA